DRPRRARFGRAFGIGYYRKDLRAAGIDLSQVVYSPYGDDPVLLDDVTLRNTTHRRKRVSWFEYWDVEPYDQAIAEPGTRGVDQPSYSRRTRTLEAAQTGGGYGNDNDPLVAKYRRRSNPLRASERSWSRWLPKASFGPGHAWVARELTWDAYLLRSASMYEELCGHHTITQGGYYQYYFGYNLGFRSW